MSMQTRPDQPGHEKREVRDAGGVLYRRQKVKLQGIENIENNENIECIESIVVLLMLRRGLWEQ